MSTKLPEVPQFKTLRAGFECAWQNVDPHDGLAPGEVTNEEAITSIIDCGWLTEFGHPESQKELDTLIESCGVQAVMAALYSRIRLV